MGWPGTWEQRLLTRLTTHTADDGACRVWVRAKDRDGYGVTSAPGRKQVRVHRAAYEIQVGPVPAGLVIDHLCRNRACVRLDHLEVVTVAVNTMRGTSPTIALHHANQCSSGHAYTTDNTYIRKDGARTCRTCMRGYKAAWKLRASSGAA